MRYGFLNAFKAALAQPLAVDATTLELADGGDRLVGASEDYRYRLTLFKTEVIDSQYVETAREVIDVTGVSGNTLTIVGGLEGTTRPAEGWEVGTKVELRFTAELLATGAGTWSAFDDSGLVEVHGDGTATSIALDDGFKKLPVMGSAETLEWATAIGSTSRRVTLSPDEKYLVVLDSTYDDNTKPTARVYDTDTNSLTAELPGVPADTSVDPYSAVFSPDGSRLFIVLGYYSTNVNPDDKWEGSGVIRCYSTADWTLEREVRADEQQFLDLMYCWGPRDLAFIDGTTKIVITSENNAWNETNDGREHVHGFTVLDTSDWSISLPEIPYTAEHYAATGETIVTRNLAVVPSLNKLVATHIWSGIVNPALVFDYDTLTGTYTLNKNIDSAQEDLDNSTGDVQSGAVFVRDDRYAWVVTIADCGTGVHLFRIIDLVEETVWYPADGTQEMDLGKVKDTAAIDEDNGTVTFFTNSHVLTYDLDSRTLLSNTKVSDINGLSPWKFGVFSHKDQSYYGSVGDGIQQLPYDPRKQKLSVPQQQVGVLKHPVPPAEPEPAVEPVVMLSDVVDLADSAAVATFPVSDGKTLYVDRFDVVVVSASDVAGDPAIQIGADNTTPGNYLGNTLVTSTVAGGRETHEPLLLDGTTSLEVSVAAASTGTDHKVRVVLHGFVTQA